MSDDNEEVLDVRGMFTPGSRLKAQLMKAKEYTNLDVSKYKVGKCYHLKGDDTQAMLINAIVLNPVSAVPMAMGFLATVLERSDGPGSAHFMQYSTDLANLGKECYL
ncbi:hypothetical protein D9M68_18810 [compost metagenome]